MKKQLLIIGYVSIVATGCNTISEPRQDEGPKNLIKETKKTRNDSAANGIAGTWISCRPFHFHMVEVIDSGKASICKFDQWRPVGKGMNKRVYYFKADGKLSITYGSNFTIEADSFKYYYFLDHDTLFQMAEPGRVDTLLKVYSDSVLEN